MASRTQYYTACTLDGFIATPDDSLEWLFPLVDINETSYPDFIREVGALDRGYDLTLVKDAHTTPGIALGDGSRIDAAGIVKDLNVAMTWISYPGRKSGTAAAEDVEFVTPADAR